MLSFAWDYSRFFSRLRDAFNASRQEGFYRDRWSRRGDRYCYH
jgi:hypothetical protein